MNGCISEKSIEKVRTELNRLGYEGDIIESQRTIKTVEDAAQAIGVEPGKILKSLILLTEDGPVLVLMSGVNKVDLKKVKELLNAKKVKFASPEYIRENFGYEVGGVPPLGYEQHPPTLLDRDLLKFDMVWAAAGSEFAYFPVPPRDLVVYTSAEVADISKH
ncbi:YbaK/prolyl-tRNA synthetase associated region [Thermovirga lienii DSM 17291]|jgi:Cys-tRNA(Pro) deacylase|uniref:YbaK/prolyl-tRNA synthetase associated region n=1 Tax=Thermovirga lienii (strain ATCC BAA-1197 / DSM 17291 / Cas60314) TaxID=580340 RepID=G7V6X1_THELD|nr:YbaK/EbsC family protein [Thermovirga lienii]MDN5319168.1 hypothetical protein [Thermovirga sp.]AER67160.1 YbaK/prolyl-tRNA synthetase associated region [Thermovirga lienii DSM 17291]KUK42587.1 MAG: YbaK/prolyl-tRNA synthetase associated region [Thermovirga lienii]MDN5367763.1 hypothetical protein [Thermovirga sp.]HCD72136.1 YbaK/EbsC family protein [Thermovirga lienii]